MVKLQILAETRSDAIPGSHIPVHVEVQRPRCEEHTGHPRLAVSEQGGEEGAGMGTTGAPLPCALFIFIKITANMTFQPYFSLRFEQMCSLLTAVFGVYSNGFLKHR